MHPLIGLITLLTVLLLVACMVLVGRARGRYQVKAPATTGPSGPIAVIVPPAWTIGRPASNWP